MPDPLTCTAITWRGTPAISLSNGRIDVVASARGGHLCSLTRSGDQLNPLWQPQWMPGDAIDDDAATAATLDGICGSNLCVDRFGPPRPGERRPLHGEAGTVTWRIAAGGTRVVLEAWLPQARLRVRRRLALHGDQLVADTAVRPSGTRERDVEWCEHTTLGGDFLDGVAFSAAIGPARDMHGEPVADPLPMPAPSDPPTGSVRTAPVRAGWWRAENPRLGAVLEARWDPRDFPHLCLWTQHKSRTQAPWLGRERTRGMELATKPLPIPTPSDAPRSWRHTLTAGRWHSHRLTLQWTREA